MFSGYRYIDCLKQVSIAELLEGTPDVYEVPVLAAVSDLFAILEDSPTASLMMDELCSYDFKFSIDPTLEFEENGFQSDIVAILFPDIRPSDIKYQKNQGRLIINLVSAIRRGLKANQGYRERFDLVPQDFLRLNRLVEADIDAVTAQVCWELRTAGQPAAWRQLLAGDKGDIAIVFSNRMTDAPLAAFDGKALRAAFRQWFANPARPDHADRAALEFLDMAFALRTALKMKPENRLDENDLRRIQKSLPFPSYLNDMNVMGRWFDGLCDSGNRAHLDHIISDLKTLPR